MTSILRREGPRGGGVLPNFEDFHHTNCGQRGEGCQQIKTFSGRHMCIAPYPAAVRRVGYVSKGLSKPPPPLQARNCILNDNAAENFEIWVSQPLSKIPPSPSFTITPDLVPPDDGAARRRRPAQCNIVLQFALWFIPRDDDTFFSTFPRCVRPCSFVWDAILRTIITTAIKEATDSVIWTEIRDKNMPYV